MKTFHLTNYTRTKMPLAVWLETPRIQRQERHTQDCMEIMFICSGSGCCRVNDRHFPMVRGDFYVMTPEDTHEFTVEKHLSFYNAIFQKEIFTPDELSLLETFPLFRKWSFPGNADEKKITYSINYADRLEVMLRDISEELRRQHAGFELQAKSLFMQFIIYALRHAGNAGGLSGGACDSQLSRIFDYISRHYMEKITIEQLARYACISPNYLGELFKKTTGLGVSDYIIRHRLEKARAALEDSDVPIGELALNLGFYDSSHFIRNFQLHTDLTPKEYRNLSRHN